MDDVDIAAEQTELYLADRLRAVRRRAEKQPLMFHEGVCLNCDADLPTERQRFCDPSCAQDWQHRREVRRKQGGQE